MKKHLYFIIALLTPTLLLIGAGCRSQQVQDVSTTTSSTSSSTTHTAVAATTTITYLVPKKTYSIKNTELAGSDDYEKKMIVYAQQGGVSDPSKTWPFVKKTAVIPFTTNTIKMSAQAAADEMRGGEAAQIVYFKTQGTTAYILLRMDVDGWAGVGVTIALTHPAVEKTLLQFPEIKNVVFDFAPEDKNETFRKKFNADLTASP
jgi:hypothetical protein